MAGLSGAGAEGQTAPHQIVTVIVTVVHADQSERGIVEANDYASPL